MKKFLLFVPCLFLSCDKSGPTEYGYVLSDVRFVTGTRYTYAWSMELRDSLGNLEFARSDTIVVTVEATNDQVDTLDGLTRVRGYSLVDSIGSILVWYQTDQNSCTEVAYKNAGAIPFVLPKKGRTSREMLASVRVNPFFIPWTIQKALPALFSPPIDSLIIRDDPRVVFRYPLNIGQSWISFTDPWLQTREVVASEFVTVPHGTFYCAKIRTETQLLGGDLEWFDYVGENGLTMRTIKIKLTITTAESPEGIGTMLAFERAELLKVE